MLAPGQLWKPGDKIQFPAPDLARTRRAMVWTLDERKQPQPRQVELGITDGITANWGADGPARNRFYGFDKLTGELCWATTPGIEPTSLRTARPSQTNNG